jgi:hypothetical protein
MKDESSEFKFYSHIKEEIDEVMEILEDYCTGGIGKTGPTIEILEACAMDNGSPYDDDAGYHTVQTAWRMLEKLQKNF